MAVIDDPMKRQRAKTPPNDPKMNTSTFRNMVVINAASTHAPTKKATNTEKKAMIVNATSITDMVFHGIVMKMLKGIWMHQQHGKVNVSMKNPGIPKKILNGNSVHISSTVGSTLSLNVGLQLSL